MGDDAERLLQVNFVIRAPADELQNVERSLARCKAGDSNLVGDQVGAMDYNVVELSKQNENLLEELALEDEKRADLEQRIQEVSDRTEQQALALLEYAHQVQDQTSARVKAASERYETVNLQFQTAKEEFRDYAEVRDRCIHLKILKEVLDDNSNALYNRLQRVAERIGVLQQTIKKADLSLEQAREEHRNKNVEMSSSRADLQGRRDEAVRETEIEMKRVADKDLELMRLHETWDAETRKQVAKLQKASQRNKTSSMSKNEKQKLRLLSYSKELTMKEQAATLVLLKKKKLVRDFNQLKEALQLQVDREARRHDREREKVQALQGRLKAKRRQLPGKTVEERLAALERQEQKAAEAEWRARIEAVHKARMDQSKLNKKKAKEVFTRVSKELGEEISVMNAATIKSKMGESNRMGSNREEMEARLTQLAQVCAQYQDLQQSKTREVEELKQLRAQQRRMNEGKLKELRSKVKQMWKKYNISSRVTNNGFLKPLFNEICTTACSPQALMRCKEELTRLLAVKRIHGNILAREKLSSMVKRKKKAGLAPMSKAQQDSIAADLWKYTEVLNKKDVELVNEIMAHEKRYPRLGAFKYLGRPYLAGLQKEMNQRDETVDELVATMPHLEAHLMQVEFKHAHSRSDLDKEYLEAHKKLYKRSRLDKEEHTRDGDIGYHQPDIDVVHNTMQRLGYDDEDIM